MAFLTLYQRLQRFQSSAHCENTCWPFPASGQSAMAAPDTSAQFVMDLQSQVQKYTTELQNQQQKYNMLQRIVTAQDQYINELETKNQKLEEMIKKSEVPDVVSKDTPQGVAEQVMRVSARGRLVCVLCYYDRDEVGDGARNREVTQNSSR